MDLIDKMRTKTNRGVAGLTILLSLVTMLFVIGLLVMIFSLMGGELRDATYTKTTVSVANETGAYLNQTGYTVNGASAKGFGSFTITEAWNWTSGVKLATSQYSYTSAGVVTNATSTEYANVSLSYTYKFDADNSATDVINDTTSSIATVTNWYPIFIVIGAMIVLILLTVLIITAIRGSGLMAEGSA